MRAVILFVVVICGALDLPAFRKKLAEALAMTEKVAEIVRAMEPRFGAIDRELSHQHAKPAAAAATPAASWTLQQVPEDLNGSDFFVA